MDHHTAILLFAAIPALCGAAPRSRTRPGWEPTNNNIEIYKASKDSVAYITSTVLQRTFFFEVVPTHALGSGFLITADGQILTNNHVISGSSKVEVASPIKPLHRKSAGGDAPDDLALIQIDPKKKLQLPEAGRFRCAAGGPKGAGHRQSLRIRRHPDHRRRELAGARNSEREQYPRRHDPDRRRHQRRQ